MSLAAATATPPPIFRGHAYHPERAMLLLNETPKAVERYREIGGALDFAFFADTDADGADLLSAIAQAIERGKNGWVDPPRYTVDQARLMALTSEELGMEEFLGGKVEGRTGELRYRGRWRMTSGQTLVDPSWRQLGRLRGEGVTIAPGSGGTTWSADGRFGQAFTHQPYSLRGDPERIQKVYDAIRALLLQPGKRCRILDWSGPQLRALSNYFQGAYAYDGEHLFTVHVKEDRSLAVISGALSD